MPRRTAEKLGKLRPVFDPQGTVTAGNASSINDAAAAVVLMEAKLAAKRGLKPLGRLVAYSYAGVDPKFMGIGPVPAVRSLLQKAGLTVDDIDVFEVNEAFAAQAHRRLSRAGAAAGPHQSERQRHLAWPPDRRNRCDPVLKALYELQRTGGKRALVTMCIGGGQGIAAIFEHG